MKSAIDSSGWFGPERDDDMSKFQVQVIRHWVIAIPAMMFLATLPIVLVGTVGKQFAWIIPFVTLPLILAPIWFKHKFQLPKDVKLRKRHRLQEGSLDLSWEYRENPAEVAIPLRLTLREIRAVEVHEDCILLKRSLVQNLKTPFVSIADPEFASKEAKRAFIAYLESQGVPVLSKT